MHTRNDGDEFFSSSATTVSAADRLNQLRNRATMKEESSDVSRRLPILPPLPPLVLLSSSTNENTTSMSTPSLSQSTVRGRLLKVHPLEEPPHTVPSTSSSNFSFPRQPFESSEPQFYQDPVQITFPHEYKNRIIDAGINHANETKEGAGCIVKMSP